MKQETEVLKAIWSAIAPARGWSRLVVLAALTLAVATIAISSTGVSAAGGDIEVWPAYYDRLVDGVSTPEHEIVYKLMGPSGNSANPNGVAIGCFGLGPVVTKGKSPKELPEMYVIFYPEATQMYCRGGDGEIVEASRHDMIVTVMRGDPGYNAKVQIIRCNPASEDFAPPYTGQQEILDAEVDGALTCFPVTTLVSPVVQGSFSVLPE